MSNYKADSCVAVAKGGVGESGASSLLVHKLDGKTQKIVVLRNVNSSLCGNTGAVGVLVVNGKPVAQGDITKVGNSIQTPVIVGSGDVVAAIVHTIPTFNTIVCIRLGELSFVLNECDLV
jgi:hypothetical protein